MESAFSDLIEKRLLIRELHRFSFGKKFVSLSSISKFYKMKNQVLIEETKVNFPVPQTILPYPRKQHISCCFTPTGQMLSVFG
jgi:hypothetical protein